MFRAHLNRRPSHQSGQALPLALLLMVGAAFLLLSLFSSGRLIADKQRLIHAADAAALSAATWRARVLNYLAYSNRAIVAQEVAVAQAVTLASWSRYLESLSQSAETLSAIYPPAAAILSGLSGSAEIAREATQAAADAEIAWRADPLVGYKAMLARSQSWLLRSADSFGLSAVANEVARASDSRFFAFALSDGGEFSRFTRLYETDQDRQRLREVVMASLDGFTGGDRSDDLRLLPAPSSCVGRSLDFDKWTLWYRKRGATALSEDLQAWVATDTGSVHDWRPGGFLGLGACRDREALPLGWGTRSAGSGERLPTVGRVADNPAALALAQVSNHGGETSAPYDGLARIHELNYLALADTDFPRSRLAVLARLEASDIRTADQAGLSAGRMKLHDAATITRLGALAAAEVYFRPPPSESDRVERASLFSPYWQARLVEPSEAQRSAAVGHVR